MSATATARFAEVSLRLYAHEGTFRIEIALDDDLENAARAFERAGCAVEREPLSHALTVTCRKAP